MLKTLRLHNFRTFLNAEINFTHRHLIIGSNNSGKTNLCKALQFLSATASHELPTAGLAIPGGVTEAKNWSLDSDTFEIGCTCELPFDDDIYSYTYTLELALGTSVGESSGGTLALRVKREELTATGPGFDDVALLRSDGQQVHLRHEESAEGYTADTLAPRDATMLSKLYELDTNRRAITFRRYLASWVYFSLSPAKMRFGFRESPVLRGALASDGGNLPQMLFQLKNIDEQRYRRVIQQTCLIEPALEAVNFIPAPDQPAVPFLALSGNPRASWHGLSDGTLRALALALIVEMSRPSNDPSVRNTTPVIMVEEPENGVFPGHLRAFFDSLDLSPAGGQFLFTSHSPYFINFFDADRKSVTLLRRNKERTEVRSIPEPDEDNPDRLLLAEEYSMELFD